MIHYLLLKNLGGQRVQDGVESRVDGQHENSKPGVQCLINYNTWNQEGR